MSMYFGQYQSQRLKTAIFPDKDPTLAIAYLSLGLCGEAGEVANKIKKCIRDGNSYDGIADELGDVLWYIAVLAHYLEADTALNLNDIAARNLYKLSERAKNGTLQGSGDNR